MSIEKDTTAAEEIEAFMAEQTSEPIGGETSSESTDGEIGDGLDVFGEEFSKDGAESKTSPVRAKTEAGEEPPAPTSVEVQDWNQFVVRDEKTGKLYIQAHKLPPGVEFQLGDDAEKDRFDLKAADPRLRNYTKRMAEYDVAIKRDRLPEGGSKAEQYDQLEKQLSSQGDDLLVAFAEKARIKDPDAMIVEMAKAAKIVDPYRVAWGILKNLDAEAAAALAPAFQKVSADLKRTKEATAAKIAQREVEFAKQENSELQKQIQSRALSEVIAAAYTRIEQESGQQLNEQDRAEIDAILLDMKDIYEGRVQRGTAAGMQKPHVNLAFQIWLDRKTKASPNNVVPIQQQPANRQTPPARPAAPVAKKPPIDTTPRGGGSKGRQQPTTAQDEIDAWMSEESDRANVR